MLGLALLPLCVGAAVALAQVVRASEHADRFWVAVLAGAACWGVIHLRLPKPMWVYVFGHELTHAVFTWLMGGKVKKFKTSSKGGHVVVTRSNFIVSLSPYFCPLYALTVVALFALGNAVWNWRPYAVWFHLLLGLAYAFHLTMTWHILQQEQPDFTEHGFLFSAVVVFLGNMAVLLVGVPLLAGGVGILTALGWWAAAVGHLLVRLGRIF